MDELSLRLPARMSRVAGSRSEGSRADLGECLAFTDTGIFPAEKDERPTVELLINLAHHK
jgi:hypothetical protein